MAQYIETHWEWDEASLAEVSTTGSYTRLAEVEWDYESYGFDMTRVYVENPTGKLFYATDSGCSCPVPFEDSTTEDLKPITRLQDWYDHVSTRVIVPEPDNEYQYPEPTSTASIDQAETARQVIEAHLKKAATHV